MARVIRVTDVRTGSGSSPEPTVQVNVYMSADRRKVIRAQAKAMGLSVSGYINMLISEDLRTPELARKERDV